MFKARLLSVAALWSAYALVASTASADQAPSPAAQARPSGTLPLCGGIYQIGPPATPPPVGSGPVVYQVGLCFEKQGGYSVIESQTYVYYMESARAAFDPSLGRW